MVPEKEFERASDESLQDRLDDLRSLLSTNEETFALLLYRIHEDLQQIKRAIEQATTKD